MEVLDANTALLSNFEVLTLLNSLRSKGEQGRNQSGSLATITYETVKYLENSPSCVQNQDVIGKFLREIHKFKLTKEEKLMLLNLRPTTAVEINLIVQCTEQERLTEEEIEELLQIVQVTLPEMNK